MRALAGSPPGVIGRDCRTPTGLGPSATSADEVAGRVATTPGQARSLWPLLRARSRTSVARHDRYVALRLQVDAVRERCRQANIYLYVKRPRTANHSYPWPRRFAPDIVPPSRRSPSARSTPTWRYSCPSNKRLRTNINTNGPNHYHGLGPNYSSITYYTKSAASSWSAWQSRQKWAYYNPSAAVVAAESGYGQTTGDDTNVQCVNP